MVLIYISLIINDLEHLVGHLDVFFGKMSVQILCLFFNQIVVLLVVGFFL